METFIDGPNSAYATMAFPNVVDVCGLDVTALNGAGCLAVDRCDVLVNDFVVRFAIIAFRHCVCTRLLVVCSIVDQRLKKIQVHVFPQIVGMSLVSLCGVLVRHEHYVVREATPLAIGFAW